LVKSIFAVSWVWRTRQRIYSGPKLLAKNESYIAPDFRFGHSTESAGSFSYINFGVVVARAPDHEESHSDVSVENHISGVRSASNFTERSGSS